MPSREPFETTPPKVIVVTPWYGGNEGGVAVVTESLVQSLISRGVECAVVEMLSDGWRPRHRQGTHGETILSFCLRDRTAARGLVAKAGVSIRDVLAARALKALLPGDGRGCIMHFHYSLPEYERLVELCNEWHIPMVATFHGSDLEVNMLDARTRAVTAMEVRSARVITTVSRAWRDTAAGFFPESASRMVVVHNSVPPSFIAAADAAPVPPSRDIEVLFVGNLIPRKGVDVLLRAWATVATHLPQARIVIAGGGSEEQLLRQLVRELDIESSVQFLGRQSREALPTLYRRAKILAVPSRAEAFGVVLLEGQLCGAAVVASNTGGIPEVVTHNVTGMLVPPEDAAQLANALVELLNDELKRQRIAAAGSAQVSAQFTAEHISGQYLELYRQVVQGRSVTP